MSSLDHDLVLSQCFLVLVFGHGPGSLRFGEVHTETSVR